MSLFDVIRYPISNKPTKDELAALPGDLYGKWIIHVGFHPLKAWTILAVSHHYSVYGDMIESQHEISVLRKMIREYDNEHI